MEEKENLQTLITNAFAALDKLKKRFKKCERAYRAIYEESERRGKKSDRKRSKLYIPLIKTTVNIIHAIFQTSFMGKRCPIEVTRIGQRTESDLIKQNAITAVLKHEWQKSEHRIGLSKAVLSALYLPLGITTLFYDTRRKQIRTKFVPITDMAFDELSNDIFDIEHVCYRWTQSVREFEDKQSSRFYTIKDSSKLFSKDDVKNKRLEMQDIYQRAVKNEKLLWKLTTLCEKEVCREAFFDELPFHFGYCLESMPSLDEKERKEELQMYGSSIPELAREIQKEYNIKRNQKIDITENQIDPQLAIDKNSGNVAVNDINTRKRFVRFETMQGKSIRDVMQPIGEPGTYGLTEEIGMLKSEYEVTTGVNSILTGQTSPADRRAMGALQTVNAASSMRIESMMQTLQDTMLNSYAKNFVNLVWKYTPDTVFKELLEDENILETIGTQEERQKNTLSFDVTINFGTTIANEVQINQLNQLLQMLLQNGNVAPEIVEDILKELLVRMKGENAPIEKIGQQKMEEENDEPSLEEKEMSALMGGGV